MTGAVVSRSNETIDQHIGERIRFFRQQKGFSLQALAGAIGVTYQQVQKYETGANRVSASTLFKIAGVLEIGLGDVFDGLHETADEAEAFAAGAADASESREAALKLSRLPGDIRHNLAALIDALGRPQR